MLLLPDGRRVPASPEVRVVRLPPGGHPVRPPTVQPRCWPGTKDGNSRTPRFGLDDEEP